MKRLYEQLFKLGRYARIFQPRVRFVCTVDPFLERCVEQSKLVSNRSEYKFRIARVDIVTGATEAGSKKASRFALPGDGIRNGLLPSSCESIDPEYARHF
jgi:hypothetical protein